MPNTKAIARRKGAKRGNRSSWRHGLYSARSGALASRYAEGQANKFRLALESACIERHGEVTVTHAALIHTATEATRCAMANREFLSAAAEGGKPIAAELRLKFDAEYVKLLDRRDVKVAALDLDAADGGDAGWASAIQGRAGEAALPAPGEGSAGEDRDGDASATPAGEAGEPTTTATPRQDADGLYGDNSGNGCHHTTEPAEAGNGDVGRDSAVANLPPPNGERDTFGPAD